MSRPKFRFDSPKTRPSLTFGTPNEIKVEFAAPAAPSSAYQITADYARGFEPGAGQDDVLLVSSMLSIDESELTRAQRDVATAFFRMVLEVAAAKAGDAGDLDPEAVAAAGGGR